MPFRYQRYAVSKVTMLRLVGHLLGPRTPSDENGRETGVRTDIPPVPLVLCLSVFEDHDGSMGGTFLNSLFFVLKTPRSLAFSPTYSDSQSVGFGLSVRKERTSSSLTKVKVWRCNRWDGLRGAFQYSRFNSQ